MKTIIVRVMQSGIYIKKNNSKPENQKISNQHIYESKGNSKRNLKF